MSDIYTRFSESVSFRMRMDKPQEIMRLTWALGLVGETGEVVDLVKKHIGHSHPLDRDKLVKELGDVEWYMEAMRQAYALERNNTERYYGICSGNVEMDICKEALNLASEVGVLACLETPSAICTGLHIVDSYLSNIYRRFGITREEALEANIVKLTERYPNGFNTADSINRKDVKP